MPKKVNAKTAAIMGFFESMGVHFVDGETGERISFDNIIEEQEEE